jgi:hypothetical protein
MRAEAGRFTRWLPLAGLALALAGTVAGQEPGRIAGKVRDEVGLPMVGVRVRVESTERAGVTDSTGAYAIDTVAAGMVNLVAQAEGFKPLLVTGVSVVAGATATRDLVLEPLRSNGRFLIAAYAVAGAIYLAYLVSLVRRAGKVTTG